jgi:hypothetical protein
LSQLATVPVVAAFYRELIPDAAKPAALIEKLIGSNKSWPTDLELLMTNAATRLHEFGEAGALKDHTVLVTMVMTAVATGSGRSSAVHALLQPRDVQVAALWLESVLSRTHLLVAHAVVTEDAPSILEKLQPRLGLR